MTHLFSLIAIASQLASAPANEAPAEGSSKASMRRPVEIKHKSKAGQQVVEGLAGVLAQELSALDRTRLGRKVLSASRVSIVQGTFSGGGTRAVAVNVNLRMKDETKPQQYISGVFTVTDTGGLIAVVVPPRMRPTKYAFEKLGDSDGDGSDDFVYTAQSDQSITRHRVTWNGTKPSTSTLQN